MNQVLQSILSDKIDVTQLPFEKSVEFLLSIHLDHSFVGHDVNHWKGTMHEAFNNRIDTIDIFNRY